MPTDSADTVCLSGRQWNDLEDDEAAARRLVALSKRVARLA